MRQVSEMVPIERREIGIQGDGDSCLGHTASTKELNPALSPALDLKQ